MDINRFVQHVIDNPDAPHAALDAKLRNQPRATGQFAPSPNPPEEMPGENAAQPSRVSVPSYARVVQPPSRAELDNK